MIPLDDNQPTSTFPIITLLIIAINVLVYIAQQILPLEFGLTLIPAELTHSSYIAQLPAQVHAARVLAPWVTIFTSMFLHSGLLHLGSNMLFFWVFGNNIEDALGKIKFIIFYLACGVIAAFSQVLSAPNSINPMLGASGAIAGVLGAYYILYPQARVLTILPFFIITEIRAWIILGLWFILEIFQGLAGIGMQQNGGVAYFAHIGGFIAGLVIIQIMGGVNLVDHQRQRTRYIYPPSDRGGWN